MSYFKSAEELANLRNKYSMGVVLRCVITWMQAFDCSGVAGQWSVSLWHWSQLTCNMWANRFFASSRSLQTGPCSPLRPWNQLLLLPIIRNSFSQLIGITQNNISTVGSWVQPFPHTEPKTCCTFWCPAVCEVAAWLTLISCAALPRPLSERTIYFDRNKWW